MRTRGTSLVLAATGMSLQLVVWSHVAAQAAAVSPISAPLLHDGPESIPAFGMVASEFFRRFGSGANTNALGGAVGLEGFGHGARAEFPGASGAAFPGTGLWQRDRKVRLPQPLGGGRPYQGSAGGVQSSLPPLGACVEQVTPLLGCQRVTCEMCTTHPTDRPDDVTTNATCREPGTGLEAAVAGGPNVTLTFYRAVIALFLKFEPSEDEDKNPCACEYKVRATPRGGGGGVLLGQQRRLHVHYDWLTSPAPHTHTTRIHMSTPTLTTSSAHPLSFQPCRCRATPPWQDCERVAGLRVDFRRVPLPRPH